MIKKTVAYTDFEGQPHVEDLWFHLSEDRLISWLASEDDLPARLQAIGTSADGVQIINTFRDILRRSYGLRIEGDATRFDQSEEITKNFFNSLAFGALLRDIISDPDKAAEFINGIFPAELMATAQEVVAKNEGRSIETVVTSTGAFDIPARDLEALREKSGLANPWDSEGKPLPWAYRHPTDRELMKMTQPQMQQAMKRKLSGWTPPQAADGS